ncbi:MAG: peptidoglycan-binding protein [Polyangiaceae bacterium]|nr:peptidoglycan-binding protein [Polyangiaceae bacterium]
MKPYVVKQGDYLDKVAFAHGVEPKELWDHAKNAELRARRGDGSLLSAGDVLWLPDPPSEGIPFDAKRENRYTAHVPSIPVSLVLERGGAPLPDEPYRVRGLFDDAERRSDGDGRIRFKVPAHVGEVVIELPERQASLVLALGHLDPVSEPSGARMRLENLGYGAAVVAGRGRDAHRAHDDAVFQRALQGFQADAGLEPTGALDAATQQALVDRHGS